MSPCEDRLVVHGRSVRHFVQVAANIFLDRSYNLEYLHTKSASVCFCSEVSSASQLLITISLSSVFRASSSRFSFGSHCGSPGTRCSPMLPAINLICSSRKEKIGIDGTIQRWTENNYTKRSTTLERQRRHKPVCSSPKTTLTKGIGTDILTLFLSS